MYISGNQYHLQSDQVDVFPISSPRQDKLWARAINEGNLRTLIRGLNSSDSYVISETFDPTKRFEFLLGGYHIQLFASDSSTFKDELSAIGNNIYAVIFVDITKDGSPQLWGSDVSDSSTGTPQYYYNGVSLVSDPNNVTVPKIFSSSDEYEKYSLNILSVDSNNNLVIPPESKYAIHLIDGGEID